MAAGDNTIPDLATNGFSVSYDAASQNYFIALPSYAGAPGSRFQLLNESSGWYSGVIDGGMNPASIAFLKPGSTYQYTNLATVDLMIDHPTSIFAFGQATPAGSVPVAGSASYAADVSGMSFNPNYYLRGSATLNFNFAAGTLGGQLDLYLYDLSGGALSLGTYSFINPVYAIGSTTFSSGLRNGVSGLTGTLTGLFAGPNAEELMGRWNADYVNPDTHATETAVGALIGRRIGGP